ncbi:hypothetical protein PV392_15755 [Streptomyces sp. ME03-5709C]|nr:hypothetical protein [Streptomyces sp. ME03-5709C]
MSTTERAGLLSQLWDEHLRAEFPGCLRGRVIEGEDLVLLDAMTAGCVSSSLHGALDKERQGILLQCVTALEKVLQSIGDEYGNRYFARLYAMAVQAADCGEGRG